MLDPISTGLALLLFTAKEVITSSFATDVYKGVLGNRVDHFLTMGYGRFKEIISIRSKSRPENHDLLRTLRMSMLKATEMLYQSMKVDEEDKEFRKLLKKWIDVQIKHLPKLKQWGRWENPAADEFEVFFTEQERHGDKKALMVERMIYSWENYIQSELRVNLPQAFTVKLKHGWIEDDKRIYWHQAVMVLAIEALRNPNDEQSARAAKAFEHNFLAEIKLQLADIHELLLSQFQTKEILNEIKSLLKADLDTNSKMIKRFYEIEKYEDDIKFFKRIEKNANAKESVYIHKMLRKLESIQHNLIEELKEAIMTYAGQVNVTIVKKIGDSLIGQWEDEAKLETSQKLVVLAESILNANVDETVERTRLQLNAMRISWSIGDTDLAQKLFSNTYKQVATNPKHLNLSPGEVDAHLLCLYDYGCGFDIGLASDFRDYTDNRDDNTNKIEVQILARQCTACRYVRNENWEEAEFWLAENKYLIDKNIHDLNIDLTSKLVYFHLIYAVWCLKKKENVMEALEAIKYASENFRGNDTFTKGIIEYIRLKLFEQIGAKEDDLQLQYFKTERIFNESIRKNYCLIDYDTLRNDLLSFRYRFGF